LLAATLRLCLLLSSFGKLYQVVQAQREKYTGAYL
jgi:hypothetical protein